MVADGTNLWFYDRDLEQVTVKPADAALSATPAMLLSGDGDIRETFTRRAGRQARRASTGCWSSRSGSDADFREARLGFGNGGAQAHGAQGQARPDRAPRLRESDAQSRRWREAEVKFTPPAGRGRHRDTAMIADRSLRSAFWWALGALLVVRGRHRSASCPATTLPSRSTATTRLMHVIGHCAAGAVVRRTRAAQPLVEDLRCSCSLLGVAIEIAQYYMHVGREARLARCARECRWRGLGLLLRGSASSRWPQLGRVDVRAAGGAVSSRGSRRASGWQPDFLRDSTPDDALRPLADRMRPRTLDEFVGQQHVLGAGQAAAPGARDAASCIR